MADERNDKNLFEEASELEQIFSEGASYADRADIDHDAPVAEDSAETEDAVAVEDDAEVSDSDDEEVSDPGPDDPVTEALGDIPPEKKLKSKKKIIAIVVAVIVVVILAVGGFVAYNFATGAIAPANAAAKYGTFDYLDESEVTDYIMTYKKYMGYENATDDEWAQFLAAYNLTPERLRLSTVRSLLTNKAIEKRAKELNITVSDDEVNEAVEAFKYMYALDDDATFQNTLESYGQTLEGFKETRRLLLLEEKLLEADLTIAEPSVEAVRETIASVAADQASEDGVDTSTDAAGDYFTLKHCYLFAKKVTGDEATLDDYNNVELVKQEFQESGMDVSTFVSIITLYCDVDSVKEVSGDMGWDVDTTELSETAAKVLARTDIGQVSETFADGDMECFIWVDQGYDIPYGSEFITVMDLSNMPDGLYQYFRDLTLYNDREALSSDYFSGLVDNLDIVLYPMPSDVPYNVDMSAYKVE